VKSNKRWAVSGKEHLLDEHEIIFFYHITHREPVRPLKFLAKSN
jgi:hypothetical protein